MQFTWKISRTTLNEKSNFLVTFEEDSLVGRGEVSFSPRYGESAEIVREQFSVVAGKLPETISEVAEITQFLDGFELCNSLRFGLESALVHLLVQKRATTIYSLLSLTEPTKVETSFSFPIMEKTQLDRFLEEYARFPSLKIKVEESSALETIQYLVTRTPQRLRIDANESWKSADSFLMFYDQVKEYPIELFEQPLPAALVKDYQRLRREVEIPLIADESIEAEADFGELAQQFHGINVKVMKAGGYLNAIRLFQEAEGLGLKRMIGCMIETSLGISSAMNLCHGIDFVDLDGFLLIREDPFGLVEERGGILSKR
jgi:L-alanine-DL-glutamate epimerase-like enolase superfamily enzyme